MCSSSDRSAIDAALVAGQPNRRVATQYGLSEGAIRRHKAEHLPQALALAQDALESVRADDLLAQVAELQKLALGILGRAYKAGNLSAALGAIREARGCLELQAKMVATVLQLERERDGRPRVTTADIDAEIARLEAELDGH